MKKTVITTLMIAAAAMAMTACSKKPADSNSQDVMEMDNMDKGAGMGDAGAMAGGENPMVGGAPMFPDKNVVENASTAGNLKTLVAAVGAAGLVDTLKGPGPFTVFAPDDDAFKKLPEGTVETLLKPENKAMLAGILTYHVVAGKMDTAELGKMIEAGGGKAKLKTVAGGSLTASMEGDSIVLTDATGGKSTVSQADVYQSNGVAHVITNVLLPKK